TTTLPSVWVTTTARAVVGVGPPMLVLTSPPVPKVGSSWPAEGASRSSSRSRSGLARRDREALRPPPAEPARRGDRGGRERRQEENRMVHLLSENGLRYNERAIDPGAQTERRGKAWPVRVLLRGCDAPAASSSCG